MQRNKYGVRFSFILSVIVMSIFIIIITNITIERVVQKRLTDETYFLTNQQAQLIKENIEEKFRYISEIAGMVEQGLSFYDENDQNILKSYVKTNRLCMLAYADEKGNVTTYYGKKMGNISDREYFREIMNKKKNNVCQYLKTTKGDAESRVIFSAPVKNKNKVTGVVFFSMEISVLRNSLFEQSMFDNKENSMIVDENGNILVKNSRVQEVYNDADSIYDFYSKSEGKLQDLLNEQCDSIILGGNDGSVLAYAAIGENNWHLLCIVDTSTARQEYAANLIAIRRLILIASACFAFSIICLIIQNYIYLKRYQQECGNKQMQYDRIVELLLKMKCVVCEYDLVNHRMITSRKFSRIWGCEIKEDMFEQIQEYKDAHPEFDFEGLKREMNYAIENKVTTSYESIFCKNQYSYMIMEITMMPVIGEHEKVIKVLGIVRESSTEHFQLKEKVDMFDQIPGGTYRYYLNAPVQLVYVGEKLQKMLGYSKKELHEIIGEHFYNVITDEYKEEYRKFIKESASTPGVRTCQYEIKCKDGKQIPVLDTMESIKKESGSMYGYSVIVDISEYVKRQRIISQELEQMGSKLKSLRIQNSNSQMQPHFLYNALSSIREIVLDDPQYASDLIYDFTIYLRACIRTMQRGDLISINQEINNIRAYVSIEKMRMGERLNVIYDLQSEEFKIAPLSIQPLVENAIRHGIFKRGKQGGIVSIHTKTLDEYNQVIVEDNGVGFDYQKIRDEVEKGQRESIGLDNVMFRLKKKQNAKIIINSKNEVGTKITIWIPRL